MKVLFTIVTVIAIGAGVYFWQQEQGDAAATRGARPPAAVSAWEVTTGPFNRELAAVGSLRAWESVIITPAVSEIVLAVHFEDGDTVSAGTELITLQHNEELAALGEWQENLLNAEREARRLADLIKRNQVAQTELDAVRTRVAVAEHKIEEIEARIADRRIRAPFSGQLGLRDVSTGALVSPGDQITTLDDLGRMRLDFSVPATQLADIAEGQLVEARTPAYPEVFRGQITAIGSRIDPLSRAVVVRAEIPNPKGLLRPGMLMEVKLQGNERQVVLLPEESLQSRASEHYAWIIEGERAIRREIGIGARRPGWVEVTRGLRAGEVVVRDGVGKLRGAEASVTVVES